MKIELQRHGEPGTYQKLSPKFYKSKWGRIYFYYYDWPGNSVEKSPKAMYIEGKRFPLEYRCYYYVSDYVTCSIYRTKPVIYFILWQSLRKFTQKMRTLIGFNRT